MLKKLDPAIPTIATAAVLAVTIGITLNSMAGRLGATFMQLAGPASAQTVTTTVPTAQWAASATGRVEPKSGEIRIASQVPGRIVEVLGAASDRAKAGDLLVRLDDDEIYVKIAAALSEVGVREREREEEPATGLPLERRKAEDAVATAERALFAAHESFDTAQRVVASGKGDVNGLDAERTKVADADAGVAKARADLAAVNAKPNMPLPQRLESSLATARAELTAAEIALERTRIRAPIDGTVLNMLAKVGETAVPSPESALVEFGDLTGLKLRAEVEERDAAKVRVGQRVIVKADAFPDKEFEGTVSSIAPSLGSPRIATRGPRRPNDVEVVEVMVDLDGNPPLFIGMRVDTFFKLDNSASASQTKTN